jgi:hypothetical protein
MGRPKKTIRPVEKRVSLPETLVAAVELQLWSELEGKVPFGAWQEYLVRLIQADLAKANSIERRGLE